MAPSGPGEASEVDQGETRGSLQVSSSQSWPPSPLVRPQNATKANRRMPDIFPSLKSVYILRGSSWSPHTSVTAERMNKTFSPMTLVHQRDNDFSGNVLEYPHCGHKRVLTFAAWRGLQAPFSIVASARCFIFFLLQALHDLVIAQMSVCTFTWSHTPFSHSSFTVLFGYFFRSSVGKADGHGHLQSLSLIFLSGCLLKR